MDKIFVITAKAVTIQVKDDYGEPVPVSRPYQE